MNWIETAQGIITLITGALVLAGTITGLVIKLVAAFKKIKQNKDWTKILELADAAMLEAEKSQKDGADKKTMVINMVTASCKNLGIDCDLTDLSKYIDNCVDFVNKFTRN